MTAKKRQQESAPLLDGFADSLIEAGWLAAVITIPLFFNIYSSTLFDPDKGNLLRAIALMMAAAWLVGQFAASHPDEPAGSEEPSTGVSGWLKTLRHTPLAIPVLFMLAVEATSTAFSVLPRVSLWGSHTRGQGLILACVYVLVFFLVVARLRRSEQWDRLRFALVATSVPVLLYGFIQRLAIDPIPWTRANVARIGSSLGNPIFLGAYLIILIFITAEGLAAALRATRPGGSEPDEPARRQKLVLIAYGVLLPLQLVALVLTRSRGPLLGLLAALFIVGLVGTVRLRGLTQAESPNIRLWAARARRASLGLIAAVVLAVGFLAAVGLPGSPLAALRDSPTINRLSGVFDFRQQTVMVRRGIWEGVAQLAIPHEPLGFADGSIDRWNSIRPVLGSGPETLYSVFGRYHSSELSKVLERREFPDRSHNEILDAWSMSGALGLVAHLALFGSIFYCALKALGLIESRGDGALFTMLLGLATVVGALVPWVMQGEPSFLGIGIPLAMMGALVVFIAIAGLRRRGSTSWSQSDTLVLALLGAIIAHFIEIQFGLSLTSTRVLFWVLAGTLVAVASGRLQLGEPITEFQEPPADDERARHAGEQNQPRGKKKKKRKRKSKGQQKTPPPLPLAPRAPVFDWPTALMAALALSTIAFSLTMNRRLLSTTVDVLLAALTEVPRGSAQVFSLSILWVLLPACAAAFVLARQVRTSGAKPRTGAISDELFKFVGVSLGIAMLMLFIDSFSLARAVRIAKAGGDPMVFPQLMSQRLLWLYVPLFALIFALAFSIARLRWTRKHVTGIGMRNGRLLAIAGFAIWLLALSPASKAMRSNVLAKHGQNYTDERQPEAAAGCYERAIELRPHLDQLYLLRGGAESSTAKLQPSPAARETWYKRAVASLEKALELNPLRYHHAANLARNYKTWGASYSEGSLREERLRTSLEYFDTALEMSRDTVELYVQSAEVDQLLGDLVGARKRLEQALAIDPEYEPIYPVLGEVVVAEAEAASKQGNSQLAREKRLEAIDILEEAARRSPEMESTYNVLSVLHNSLGQTAEAIAASEQYVALVPKSATAHFNLAQLYEFSGRDREALEAARAARDLMPENERGRIEAIIRRLEGKAGG